MKTKAPNTENKDNDMFAFMPEMVLEHLNHATPTEHVEIEKSSEPEIQKISISAEPEIPGLDSFFEVTTKKNNKIY